VPLDLDAALSEFDKVEANLIKLELLREKMERVLQDVIGFVGGSPTGREYRQLVRDFENVSTGLPAIDGWSMPLELADVDDVARMRMDAREVDEPDALIAVEEHIQAPRLHLDEYRARFTRKRRELVRRRLHELVAEVDAILERVAPNVLSRNDHSSVRDDDWVRMEQLVAEVDRLLGDGPRTQAWVNLQRHLRFALGCDLLDIVEHDWPALRAQIGNQEHDPSEPLAVRVADLGEVVASAPTGSASAALAWESLDAEAFERLVFAMIRDAQGYENAQWLMKTTAPDKGRDLSVQRVHADTLAGVRRERVVIQCKHWLRRSIKDTDVSDLVAKMRHWEPPPVDVLVIATSGRFTSDAVSWVERHNNDAGLPRLEMWPESHLETLLAQRPHLVAEFHLR
jgi:Restriction endonuclease